MRASLTILKAWRPQMIGPTYEVVRYESRRVACRVCPEHKAVLDDEQRCPQGHEATHWEVRYLCGGVLEAQVLHRASEYDYESLRTVRPCRESRRRRQYLDETAWRLRKHYGLTVAESQAEALRRWEERVANTLA